MVPFFSAFAATVGQVAGRWFVSHIGEGIIFDLRVALFDHISRMPISSSPGRRRAP